MLAMSTLMMPAPTMACAPPIAVGPHKPPETKLLAIHPSHAQPQATPQHQIHAAQQQQQQHQQQQNQQQQQQQLSSSNKPGTVVFQCTRSWISMDKNPCKSVQKSFIQFV